MTMTTQGQKACKPDRGIETSQTTVHLTSSACQKACKPDRGIETCVTSRTTACKLCVRRPVSPIAGLKQEELVSVLTEIGESEGLLARSRNRNGSASQQANSRTAEER